VRVLALLAGLLAAAPAGAACRLALALGLDVSNSVSPREFDLQREGVAAALTDPAVAALILEAPGGQVALAVYEWSGRGEQSVLADWRLIGTRADLAALARRMRGAGQSKFTGRTGVGEALLFGAALIARAPDCARRTLDISGDGENNSGLSPRAAHAGGRLAGILVNGLVIGPDLAPNHKNSADTIGRLQGYYRARVIAGPGAFVETALDHADLARAMRRKLLRELAPALLGDAGALAPAGRGG